MEKVTETKKKIMVVDGLNALFFRSYIVDPSISNNGIAIGGLKGSLKILQKLCREVSPSKVVVCWDGEDGSSKRRSLVKEYKEGRKPLKLNNNIQHTDAQSELENRIWQMTRLVEYLNEMPIIQLMESSVEADDLISYVVGRPMYKPYNKIIVSSDKDFLQLCDDSTIVYRPVQKEIFNSKKVLEEFNIHPTNFVIARAIAGDVSDNLEGVDGVGLPTVAKRLPFLSEAKAYNIQDVVDYCAQNAGKIKAYTNIIEQIDRVRTNYKMMQLCLPEISVQAAQRVTHALENSECTWSKHEVQKMMLEDGFGEGNWEDLFLTMSKIKLDNCRDLK
jgi:DNA polymerase-1